MKNQRAASFTAWGVKDTTNIPYIIRHGDFCEKYWHPVVMLFYTRQDARDWINENRCGYVWTPVKVWIQECPTLRKEKPWVD